MHLLYCLSDPEIDRSYEALVEQLGIAMQLPENLPLACTHVLRADQQGLSLGSVQQGTQGPEATRVDFTAATLLYRLKTSGKSQGLGKALGLAKHPGLYVLDATAGLGKDSLLMAYLGCEVTMLERSPLIHALLADGLKRGRLSEEALVAAALTRMSLHQIEARQWIADIARGAQRQPDVIYLDPMFPPRNKSAKVKKDIALLQEVLGAQEDFASLLEAARAVARMRVVVKRPGSKADASVPAASFTVPGKTAHFEVYVSSSFSNMR